MSVFSNRLRSIMVDRGFNQKDLAAKAGVTESAMSYYIKGQRTPSGKVLSRIADALDTSTDYLLGNTEISGRIDDNQLQFIQRNLGKLDEEQLKKAERILKSVFDDIWEDEEDY